MKKHHESKANRRLVTAISIIMLLFAVPGTLWAVQQLWFQDPAPTEVITYVPSDVAEDGPAARCAESSLASARADAYLCIGGGLLLLDPCFTTDDPATLQCPVSSNGVVVTADEFEPFYFDEKPLVPLTIDEATGQEFPWKLELAEAVDGLPAGSVCALQTSRPAEFNGPIFLCAGASQPRGGATVVNPEKFVSGEDRGTLSIELGGTERAINLNRTNPVWTVQVKTADGWQPVPILRAWF